MKLSGKSELLEAKDGKVDSTHICNIATHWYLTGACVGLQLRKQEE